jgi:hypothetical protein
MEQHRQRRFLDLGHHPKAPLDRLRLVLHCLRQQATAVLSGEIEIDGHGFPQLEPVVIDGRDPAVRIHRECGDVRDVVATGGIAEMASTPSKRRF